MASVAMLCFLWLSLSVCSLVHCVLTATGTRKCDECLGAAVMAQLVRDQSTINAKQQVAEVTLAAARTELEATKTKLEAAETELEATETRIRAIETTPETTQTRLSAIEARLEATETNLRATETKLEATETKLQATETNLRATETKLEATETKLQATETMLRATKTKLEATGTKLEATETKLQATETRLNATGSSFVRWGRKTCPNNTSLVYVGVAGGKQYNQKGSGTNPLCLTRTPQFDNTPKPRGFSLLYGGEYQEISSHFQYDVPCSVCLAPQSSTIMVPATLTCPPGWTPQYTGHLSSQHIDYYATEYVCLDGSPEDDSSENKNENGFLFHYVVTVCGSLPCPPYINDKVVTCVVCSK